MTDRTPDFAKYPDGLVPAIVQHAITGQVLMLGYMDADAYAHTRSSGLVTFYSRSRQQRWTKGETSGNHLILRQLALDCDNDALLVLAEPVGPTCHTGADSCFTGMEDPLPTFGTLAALESTIRARHAAGDTTSSYTARLLASGMHKVAQKVGEEAVELVVEALRNEPDRFRNEAADLLYHTLVLFTAKGILLAEVEAVLRERAGKG